MLCHCIIEFLCAAVFVASAQEDYDLVFSRPAGDNTIVMTCTAPPDIEPLLDADFFRNGLLYDLPQRVNFPGAGVRFVVSPSSEGNFTCGRENSFSRIISNPPLTIVGM